MRKFCSCRTVWKLALVLVAVFLVTACQEAPVRTPTQEENATPTDTPTTLTPTSAAPQEPLPPVLIDYTPRAGQEVPTDSAIILRFDQPMDRESVANALRITPQLEGEFAWLDSSTVAYRPDGLAKATRYRVSVGTDAQSAEGLPLSTDLAFSFSTLSGLVVSQVNPEDGASELRADAPVFVTFNRAVVPLNCVGQDTVESGACFRLPLTFEPPVLGEGIWVNTSLYRFDPLQGWAAGQTYQVVLAADVPSVDGARLEAPYAWSFATAAPILLGSEPSANAKNVLLDSGIRVFFNTPMDQEITGNVFNVIAELPDGEGDRVVPGVVTWEDNGATLVFTPSQQLALDTRYTVRIGERARAVTSAPLTNPGGWVFSTVPSLGVFSFTPGDGDQDVSVHEPVRIVFSGAVDEASLEPYIILDPPVPQGGYRYFDPETGVYSLSWSKEPRTEYCVSVLPGVKDLYANTLEEPVISCFTTGDLDPFLAPATFLDAVTLDAADPARFYLLARNLDSAAFTLSSLDEGEFVRGWNTTGTAIRSWTESFQNTPNVAEIAAVDLTRSGGPLDPGYYKLVWQAEGVRGWRSEILIAVVDRQVTVKMAPTDTLVWVTDLRSGEPITRTEVQLVDEEGVLVAAGTTDLDGLAQIPVKVRENLWERVAAVVGEPGGPGFGVALTTWDGGVSPWEFDIHLDAGPFVPFNIYLYTDRPIYRPGQSVLFRGIVRQKDDVSYTLPNLDMPLLLTLRDPRGTEVYSKTLKLSEYGTFDGALSLAEDALIGDYFLQVRLPEVEGQEAEGRAWSLNFAVSAYRKPEFEVTVTPEYAELLQDDTLRADIEANYFFGGPVSATQLHWKVLAKPEAVPYPATSGGIAPSAGVSRERDWGWWDQRVIAEGDALTDADGHFLLEIPAELQPWDEVTRISSQRWVIEATVADESGFPITGQADVMVHASRFYMKLVPEQWVLSADKRADVTLLAFDWAGDPMVEQPVDLTLVRRTWFKIPAAPPDIGVTWTFTDTAVWEQEYETDDQGEVIASITPPTSGSYVLIAQSTDADGYSVYKEIELAVSGEEAALWQVETGSVVPVADADLYRVGDTAKILVPTPFTGTYQVLMTVEREGVLLAQREVVNEPNQVFELPILDAYVPNVYVSFVVLKGVDAGSPVPDARVGYVKLSVEPVTQQLNLTLIPDKTAYDPRELVELTVRTSDANGNPVDAEVGLSLVDKAVLTLRESQVPSIVDAFYGDTPLRVAGGHGAMMLLNRLYQTFDELGDTAEQMVAEMSVGGMGGGAASSMAADARQQFPDTALWEAHLRTGATGEVLIPFYLPDSVTTWVLDAKAVTVDTKVGEAQTALVATKPLLVRPITPRFLVAGDEPDMGAIIHNNTGSDLQITARLDATGVVLKDAAEQVVTVPDGGRVGVVWPVEVPSDGDGFALLTFSVQGGGFEDASRPTFGVPPDQALPIHQYEVQRVTRTAGVLETAGSQMEAVLIPPDAGDNAALVVRIEPSLVAAVSDSLLALEHAPYETTDALVSRFLPNILTYQVLRDLGVEDAEMASKLRELVLDSVDRLYTRQNPDGGWGWWKDWSNMHLTSYAALGLLHAERAGFSIREEMLQRALSYVRDTLDKALQGDTMSPHYGFALYVLTEADVPLPDGAVALIYAARQNLGTTGRAYLALALGLADPSDPRITTLLEEIRAEAEVTATGAHWEDTDTRYWSTDTSATSTVLNALIRLNPEDALVPQVVRWLLIARQGDRWQTNYETAMAVMALSNVIRATGDLGGDYRWGVALNAEPRFDDAVLMDPARDTAEMRFSVDELLRDRANALEISREAGAGRLTYAATLDLPLPAEQAEAANRGIVLQRSYCRPTASVDHVPDLCQPVEQVQAGDMVEVRLTLVLPKTRYFVLLEDPYPAGMEPVVGTVGMTLDDLMPAPETSLGTKGWWQDPFDHRELRDEKAVFFASAMPSGTYEVRYQLRATVSGIYKVLPARASEMYLPEVWGQTTGDKIVILSTSP